MLLFLELVAQAVQGLELVFIEMNRLLTRE
jgi:hypothetical protein